MIIADPENLVTTHDVTKVDAEMKQALADYPVGGIMLKSRNIENKKQLKKLLKNLQKQSEIALFLAVDEEGGNVSRVRRTSETGKAGRLIRCMNIRTMVRIRHLKMRGSLVAIWHIMGLIWILHRWLMCGRILRIP